MLSPALPCPVLSCPSLPYPTSPPSLYPTFSTNPCNLPFPSLQRSLPYPPLYPTLPFPPLCLPLSYFTPLHPSLPYHALYLTLPNSPLPYHTLSNSTLPPLSPFPCPPVYRTVYLSRDFRREWFQWRPWSHDLNGCWWPWRFCSKHSALPKIHFDQILYRKANTCVFAMKNHLFKQPFN